MTFQRRAWFILAALSAMWPSALAAQTRILPLGDSITNGGQGYASYRYPLWFDLAQAGNNVDLVGSRDFTFGGDPNPALYPEYFTTFDRDHEGYWGWRTDQIAAIAASLASADPDIVLLHLGTNDIGQQGAAGVANADLNLRAIIGALRDGSPDVVILMAQVIPIGPGTSYFDNAAQVAPLNQVIADVAADSTRPGSPIVVVDQNAGFDLGTMMQSDGLHPNVVGEARMADVWHLALEPFLPAGNPPPSVSLTAPADGAEVIDPAVLSLQATASDPNGTVVIVRFYADRALLGTDGSAPFEISWVAPPSGTHLLTAIAEDDQGATRASASVTLTVLPFSGGTPVAVANGSFESPALSDGALVSGPGAIAGWTFSGTGSTYTGIFNPPAGSYPSAGGNGTPTGADGAQAAYLFNNGGPGDSVSATQFLGEALAPATEYLLRVAIGRFLPDQPYAFSSYGGYRIELLAGSTVIASSEDEMTPPVGGFRGAITFVASSTLPAHLIGEPMSIRLDIGSDQVQRSTHFDAVQLTRRNYPTVGIGEVTRAVASLSVAPNPCAAGATLSLAFSVRRSSPVEIVAHDLLGRRTAELLPRRFLDAGHHRLEWRPDLAPGLFYLRVVTEDGASTTGLVILSSRP